MEDGMIQMLASAARIARARMTTQPLKSSVTALSKLPAFWPGPSGTARQQPTRRSLIYWPMWWTTVAWHRCSGMRRMSQSWMISCSGRALRDPRPLAAAPCQTK